jgi:hypothetical protein
MSSDRYLKAILTIIALELLWIGVKDAAPPVLAQQGMTPVIIRGVQIGTETSLPVNVTGSTRPIKIEADRPIRIEAERPIRVETLRPLKIEADTPIKIEADRPLPVEAVPFTPARRPGE